MVLLYYVTMKQVSDVFSERITIAGIDKPICFTFRMLHGEYGMEYKIRTVTPQCDFNMSNCTADESTTSIYRFSDEDELPDWINNDVNAQSKLSNAIAQSF